jgi:hypothetical protein
MREIHETSEPRTGIGAAITSVLGALVVGFAWVVFVAAVRWVLQLPPPVLGRLGAVLVVITGLAAMVIAFVNLEVELRRREQLPRRRWPDGGRS